MLLQSLTITSQLCRLLIKDGLSAPLLRRLLTSSRLSLLPLLSKSPLTFGLSFSFRCCVLLRKSALLLCFLLVPKHRPKNMVAELAEVGHCTVIHPNLGKLRRMKLQIC